MSRNTNELPYMSVVVQEWLADRAGLSLEEFGALVMVRLVFWREGGRLLTVDQVRRYSGAGKRWGAIKANVLDCFTVEGERVSCESVLKRLNITRSIRRKGAEGGKAKAQKQARAGTYEGGLNASYEGGLKRSKPLKSNKVASAQLDPSHVAGAYNQNQNRSKPGEMISPAEALEADGTLTVRLRLDIPSAEARKHIARWSAALDDDAKLLGIIHSVAERGLKGATFLRVTTEAVNRETTARMKQHVLPLPPVAVGGRRR